MRNAMLPQITSLALALGHVVSGAVLVEVVFGYPGIGSLLYKAIRGSDYLRHLRHRVHDHPRHRPGDADPRPGLPAARSAHHRTGTPDGGHSSQRCAARDCRVAAGRGPSILALRRRNPGLVIGLILLGALLLVGVVGPLLRRRAQRRAGRRSSPTSRRRPSYPLGTDDQGRDLLAVMVAGMPLTLRVGLIAGVVGLGIGTILGYRRRLSTAASSTPSSACVVDTLLTVPACWS